jgi:hypothetical protein
LLLALTLVSTKAQVNLVSVQRVSIGFVSAVPVKLTFDASGNLYAAGQGIDGGLWVAKISTNGQYVWLSTSYHGSASANDRPAAIALSPSNSLYVAAVSRVVNDDFAVIRYDDAGNILWSRTLGGSGNGDDTATAITADAQDNVYITGRTYIPRTVIDNYVITTASYDSAGALRWRSDYHPGFTHAGNRMPHAIVADTHGRIFVSSLSMYYTDPRSPYDWYVILSLNTTNGGTTVAFSGGVYPGTASGKTALGLDSAGNIYFAGRRDYYDHVVLFKLDTQLVQTWVTDYPRPGLSGLVVDGAGRAYLSGPATSPSAGLNYAIAKCDTSGNQVWENSYNGPQSLDDVPTALLVDNAGNVFQSGVSAGPGNIKQWGTVKFRPDGSLAWSALFGSETSSNFQPQTMRINDRERVFVAGIIPAPFGRLDVVIVKYSQHKASVTRRADGGIHLEFVVNPGSTNRLQRATNLPDWSDVTTLVADAEGALEYDTVVESAASRAFFRTVSP